MANRCAMPTDARLRGGTAVIAAVALAAITGAAAIGASAAEELQYEGSVAVGPDGNGWVFARFPTITGDSGVTYYLDVWTGCAETVPIREESCAAAVAGMAVTLNGEVVFRTASVRSHERVQVLLNLVGTSDNEVMASVEGRRGAVAHFSVVAVR
jgi:hypothetical protein